MLKAQQISMSTHTLNKFVFSHTHIGTYRLKMGHLAKKLTKGWGILTAKIPLTYNILNTQQISMCTHTLNKIFSLSHMEGSPN